MGYQHIVDTIGIAVEVAGVVVIIVGGVVATGFYLRRLAGGTGHESAYRQFRRGLGRAILLGLEFLVAGDIIRTVALEPTFHNLGILAGLVAIRTVLSFTLEVEISGSWPWQHSEESRQAN